MFGKNIKIKSSDILEENGEYYLSYDFIKQNIDEEIYYDVVSKKVVIASDKCLLKAKINEKEVSNNFQKENVENICVIEKNEEEYVSKCFFRGNFIEYAFGGLVAAGYDCRPAFGRNYGNC